MSVGIYLFSLKTVSDILDHPIHKAKFEIKKLAGYGVYFQIEAEMMKDHVIDSWTGQVGEKQEVGLILWALTN